MRLWKFAVGLSWVALGIAACTRLEMADKPPLVSIEGGFAGEAMGGAGSVPGEGGNDRGGASIDAGGAPSSVELGIWPSYAADGKSDEIDAVSAAVSALAAGALTLPIYERWSELSGATGSPRTLTWRRLDAMVDPYRERGGDVALCIGIVDRELPAWPFTGELDDAVAASSIERTIDEVYAHYAARLSHLCFGYAVDRYWASASSTSRKRLLAFLEHAVGYAKGHPLHAPRTLVGTALTLDALSGGSAAPLDELLLGDEAVAVYDPLDAGGELKPPESIGEELARAVDTLAARSGSRLPLALFEVSYPSAGVSGASEKSQRAYYEALFDALEPQRAAVSFVGVFGLGDRSAAECAAEAESFGDAFEADVRQGARCELGLRADTGAEKAAWPVVSRAISRYR